MKYVLKSFGIAFIVTIVCVVLLRHYIFAQQTTDSIQKRVTWWELQSVDTMKYSRDLTWEKMNDPSFDAVIDEQVGNIAAIGATHVGIATPYDNAFVPMLSRWVAAARKHNLKVWFRGNFSGWEKWFDYPRMTREEHLALLPQFIENNPKLFREGDIFTPCPECENGGPGDPRTTGDVAGHRLFLINEYQSATTAFRKIGVGVKVGYFSMNYDVARAVMDESTTRALGGIVTIDHYVASPERLVSDLKSLASQSKGEIFLGEFGAPIPDINGAMTDEQQYLWLKDAFSLLSREPSVMGVNYWVNVGGSTQLWTKEGKPRKAVQALSEAFLPKYTYGKLLNQLNKPVERARITSPYKMVQSDAAGEFILPYRETENELVLTKDGYTDKTVNLTEIEENHIVIFTKSQLSFFEKILAYIVSIFT